VAILPPTFIVAALLLHTPRCHLLRHRPPEVTNLRR
jgi:hypothetical protein